MASATAAWAPSVAAHIDLEGVTRIADISGANGSLVQLLLQADPTLRGRERSLDEYDALLTAAGLRRHRVIATDSPLSVIEAVAA